jgi:hypothetical protein
MPISLQQLLRIKSTPSESEIRLFQKAQKYLSQLSWIPGLRMIAVCNSLSMYGSDENSDIDLFVITNPRRMWLVRIFLTAILQILGVRRHGKKVAGRFCLSFFCTTEAMNFETIAIENDLYLQAWVNYLKPIINIGETYEKFLQENSGWMEILSDGNGENTRFQSIKKPLSKERLKWLWNGLDSLSRVMFEPMTRREFERLGKPWGVIISNNMLKFHPKDRRKEVRDGVFGEN